MNITQHAIERFFQHKRTLNSVAHALADERPKRSYSGRLVFESRKKRTRVVWCPISEIVVTIVRLPKRVAKGR